MGKDIADRLVGGMEHHLHHQDMDIVVPEEAIHVPPAEDVLR